MNKLMHVKIDYANRCWVATSFVRDSDGEWVEDPETVTLFGTATLPTPFTLQAGRDEVVRVISKLNPDTIIEAVS